jgi:hypothetical protein
MKTVMATLDSVVSEQITHSQRDTVSIPCKGKHFSRHNTTCSPGLGSNQPAAGVKRPEREVQQLVPSTAKVKNAWRYISTP